MKKFIEALVGFTSQIPSQVMDIFQQAVDYTKGLEAEIQRLRDEIARLKEVPVKPDIKPGKDNDEPRSSFCTSQSCADGIGN